MSTVYGYCPHCGAEVTDRKRGLNGDDTCAQGHVYPSAFTLSKLASEWSQAVRATLGLLIDEMEAVADGERGVSARKALELANRCRLTLTAIPLAGG